MKKLLAPIFGGLIVAAVAGGILFFRYTEKGESQQVGRAQPIRIANIGQYSIFNPLAKDKGYFLDNGLDAEITEYDSGATAMAALLEGRADFAVAANFVGVTNIFKDKNLRILAEVGNQDNFRLLARKDKGIAVPSDLKGKKVGATFGTAGMLYLGRFLQANGLSVTDVNAVNLSPAEMKQQFQAGDLDAILIFDPHAFDLMRQMDGQVLEWSAQGNQRAYALAYSTKGYIESHPDVVVRYLRSLRQAEQFKNEHQEDAMRFVGDALHYDSAYMKYMWQNSEFAVKLDEDMLVAMEEQARWMIDTGVTDQTSVPNYLTYIYFPALESVDASSVTIVH